MELTRSIEEAERRRSERPAATEHFIRGAALISHCVTCAAAATSHHFARPQRHGIFSLPTKFHVTRGPSRELFSISLDRHGRVIATFFFLFFFSPKIWKTYESLLTQGISFIECLGFNWPVQREPKGEEKNTSALH